MFDFLKSYDCYDLMTLYLMYSLYLYLYFYFKKEDDDMEDDWFSVNLRLRQKKKEIRVVRNLYLTSTIAKCHFPLLRIRILSKLGSKKRHHGIVGLFSKAAFGLGALTLKGVAFSICTFFFVFVLVRMCVTRECWLFAAFIKMGTG